jgi:hypothetical protein
VDSSHTTVNTNPIILDSRGECNLWLDTTLAYKLVLEDSAGNLIWSVDEVTSGGSGGGGTLVAPVTLGPPAFAATTLTLLNFAGSDGLDIVPFLSGGIAIKISGSIPGALDGVFVGNTNPGATAITQGVVIGNDTGRTFNLGKTSSLFSGAFIANGPTGEICFIQAGGQIPIVFGSGSTTNVFIDGQGGVTINAPQVAQSALNVLGFANQAAVNAIGSGASGTAITAQGSNLLGTSSSHFNTMAGTVTMTGPVTGVTCTIDGPSSSGTALQVSGSQLVGTPTGGDKGAGSINAVSLFVNGIAVSTANLLPLNNTWTGTNTYTPGSGIAITANGVAGSDTVKIIAPNSAGNSFGLVIQAGTNASDFALVVNNASGSQSFFTIGGDGHFSLGPVTSGVNAITCTVNGNVAIQIPATGTPLTVLGSTNAIAAVIGLLTITTGASLVNGTAELLSVGQALNLGTTSSSPVGLYTSALQRIAINAAGNITINTPSSGTALTVNGVSGTHSTQIADSATALHNAGYLEVPQNNVNPPYTLVLADSGKHILNNSGGAGTYTIPANASVAYPLGTVLTFCCIGAATMSIAINTDTLVLAGTSTSGTRSLAVNGIATAIKVASTQWQISGPGLS